MAGVTKVGIIACSGEEIPAGTISRLATRRVLESLRPQSTVTLCLPLFLAGEEQERRFAREHPTITVDGCDKLCAKRGTETYSGQVACSLNLTDILGDRLAGCHRSQRDSDKADEQAIWIAAERIAAEVDELLAAAPPPPLVSLQVSTGSCACSRPSAEGMLKIDGETVAINGLPLIFAHLHKKGLAPGEGCADRLLETVRIYHDIEPGREGAYREALVASYQEFWGQIRPTVRSATGKEDSHGT
jgi:uncharacterized metal-binding protein